MPCTIIEGIIDGHCQRGNKRGNTQVLVWLSNKHSSKKMAQKQNF